MRSQKEGNSGGLPDFFPAKSAPPSQGLSRFGNSEPHSGNYIYIYITTLEITLEIISKNSSKFWKLHITPEITQRILGGRTPPAKGRSNQAAELEGGFKVLLRSPRARQQVKTEHACSWKFCKTTLEIIIIRESIIILEITHNAGNYAECWKLWKLL